MASKDKGGKKRKEGCRHQPQGEAQGEEGEESGAQLTLARHAYRFAFSCRTRSTSLSSTTPRQRPASLGSRAVKMTRW